tara:strand:+ start:52 stop:246 length:195 start_codon:yes stop_codon:yes gene_type:complete
MAINIEKKEPKQLDLLNPEYSYEYLQEALKLVEPITTMIDREIQIFNLKNGFVVSINSEKKGIN